MSARRHALPAPLAAALFALALGCGSGCPPGFLMSEGRCFGPDASGTMDAGPPRDAGDSGAVDANRPDTTLDAPDPDAFALPCDGLCTGTTPVCVAEVCVACGADGDCAGDDRCELTGHACVACLGSAGDVCPASTVCDAITNTCVACLTSTDCTTAGAPLCDVSTNT